MEIRNNFRACSYKTPKCFLPSQPRKTSPLSSPRERESCSLECGGRAVDFHPQSFRNDCPVMQSPYRLDRAIPDPTDTATDFPPHAASPCDQKRKQRKLATCWKAPRTTQHRFLPVLIIEVRPARCARLSRRNVQLQGVSIRFQLMLQLKLRVVTPKKTAQSLPASLPKRPRSICRVAVSFPLVYMRDVSLSVNHSFCDTHCTADKCESRYCIAQRGSTSCMLQLAQLGRRFCRRKLHKESDPPGLTESTFLVTLTLFNTTRALYVTRSPSTRMERYVVLFTWKSEGPNLLPADKIREATH